MKVLLIDDDPEVRETLSAALHESGGWQVMDRDFGGISEALAAYRPDFVVLDLIEGAVVDDLDSGNASFESIREHWFCPVIVYSAFPNRQQFAPHPLVICVKKGTGSEILVRDRLTELRPQAEMVAEVHREFDSRIRKALRDSALELSDQLEEQPDSVDSLARSVRRLVAARIDEAEYDQEHLHAWERYVVPPLGTHLLTADLLRRTDAVWTDPASFRLVLTPSCDLASHGDTAPRADTVLVARCEPVAELETLRSGAQSNQRKKLRSLLNEGAIGRHLPIPCLQGKVPSMVANLKRLELLPWAQIIVGDPAHSTHPEPTHYRRIASTDSPFREMVTWAYLQVAGRPGLPRIDTSAWSSEIVASGQVGENQ